MNYLCILMHGFYFYLILWNIYQIQFFRAVLHVRLQKCHFKSIRNDCLVNLISMYGQTALNPILAFRYFFKSLIHYLSETYN